MEFHLTLGVKLRAWDQFNEHTETRRGYTELSLYYSNTETKTGF